MRNNQMNWVIAVSAVALLGTAVVTLRAAEHVTQHAASTSGGAADGNAVGMRSGIERSLMIPYGESVANGLRTLSLGAKRGGASGIRPAADLAAGATGSGAAGGPAANAVAAGAAPAGAGKQHPPASAPEESATITDDPTTAPDPSQSADNNVSFPTDT